MVKTADIDILVNNAGILQEVEPIRRQDPDSWQRVIDVNLRSAFLMSRAAAQPLRQRGGGSIVNIASIAGITGFPGSHAYGVSKAGLVMLTKTLACELAKHAIRVNAIAPGVIDAPMLERMSKGNDQTALFASRVPLRRLGTPEDIGGAVAFLCSNVAAYITGITLPVDGGWTAFGGVGPASAAPTEPAR